VLEGGQRVALVDVAAMKEVSLADLPMPEGLGRMELTVDAVGRKVVRTALGSGAFEFVVRLHAQ
jgi:hypothetical protein